MIMFLYQKLDLLQYHTTNMPNQEVGISEATKEAGLESMLMIVRLPQKQYFFLLGKG